MASMQPSSNLQQRLKGLQRRQEEVITTLDVQEAGTAPDTREAVPLRPPPHSNAGMLDTETTSK